MKAATTRVLAKQISKERRTPVPRSERRGSRGQQAAEAARLSMDAHR